MERYMSENGLQNFFVGIAGLIGAGKTTLATALGEHLDLPVYFEPVADNEYLSDFYQDPGKYAFATQIYLLNRRFQQHQEIIWKGRSAVQDRTIYEDSIFAKMLVGIGLMDERDYRTYQALFEHMSNFMCRPNVIVYLDVTPEESLQRVQMRGRECESGLPLEYLRKLASAYEDFLDDISQIIPVLRVSWHQFQSAKEMATCIGEKYRAMRSIQHVDFKSAPEKPIGAAAGTPEKKVAGGDEAPPSVLDCDDTA